jgi:hypothetical protein
MMPSGPAKYKVSNVMLVALKKHYDETPVLLTLKQDWLTTFSMTARGLSILSNFKLAFVEFKMC